MKYFPPEPTGLAANQRERDEAQRERDDQLVREYATPDHQTSLREKIRRLDLPVSQRRVEVAEKMEKAISQGNGVILLQGETGSGKSIFSPLILRQVLRKLGRRPRVVVMQPRKDATSGVTRAMAAVADERLGDTIGFSTSEMKATHINSEITVVTPGIFLRYLMSGTLTAKEVGAIIVDELHEGSLDYHLALGLMRLMQQKGELPPTLLTSATLNREVIQQFFDIPNEQYLKVEGRRFPVNVEYSNLASQERSGERDKYGYIRLAAEEVKRKIAKTQGDMLVFMPGAREINDCIKQIGEFPGVEVVPLHGQLSPKERDYALAGEKPRGVRQRVIVCTNIAETSVTVPGVTLVVDSCRERSFCYNPNTGINEKGTNFISQDQAEQRAGRAGRTQAGVCVRILSVGQFAELPQHPKSEIRRSNLSQVILRLRSLGLDPRTFPFIDAPESEALAGGEKELQALGALDQDRALTALGQEMGVMPFGPRVSKMLLEARRRKCLEATLVLAAFEREGDVLLGPTRRDEAEARGYDEKSKKINARKTVQAIQNRFDRADSDWLKALNVFAEALENGVMEAMRHDKTSEARAVQAKFRQWCDNYYLKAEALTHIAYRLQDYARYAGVQLDVKEMVGKLKTASDVELGAVIVASHPDRILYLSSKGRGLPSYKSLNGGYSGNEINMSPGSEAFDRTPQLCVAADISQGGGSTKRDAEVVRNYANRVHPIRLEVLRAALPDLLEMRRKYPEYDKANDRVMADVIFYPRGQSSIELGTEAQEVTGPEAVQVFARALVEGKVDLPCFKHNQTVYAELEALRQRSRGQVVLPKLEEWYVDRLGGVSRKAEASYIDEKLRLNVADFYPPEVQVEVDRLYPKEVNLGGVMVSVKYSFTAKSTWDAERFSASVNLTEELVDRLEQSDIPLLGLEENPVPLTLEVIINYSRVSDTDINVLKDALDKQRQKRAWQAWEKPEPVPLVTHFEQLLPKSDELDQKPVAYAINRKGDPVMAYSAVVTRSEYDNEKKQYIAVFFVEYFSDQDTAQASQLQAEKKKRELDAAEQQQRDLIVLLEPAKKLFVEVGPRVDEVVANGAAFGFDFSAVDGLRRRKEEAENLLKDGDSYSGMAVIPNPRQAIEILTEITQSLDEKAEKKKRQQAAFEQAKGLEGQVSLLVHEKLQGYRFRSFGLGEEAGRELLAKWEQAESTLRDYRAGYSSADAEEALLALQSIQTELQDRTLNISPLQAGFFDMLEGSRYQERIRVIEVRGGQAMRSMNLAGEETPIKVLRGDKYKNDRRRKILDVGTYKRAYMQGNELSVWSRSGNTLDQHYILSDGLFVIGEGGRVFKVRQLKGSYEALAEIPANPVDYDRGIKPQVGYGQSLEADDWEEENVGMGGEDVVAPESTQPVQPAGPKAEAGELAKLAFALGGNVRDKRKPVTQAAPQPLEELSTPTQPSVPVLPLEPKKPVEPEVMTPELLIQFSRQLQFSHSLIQALRALGEKPRLKAGTRPTDQEKAITEIYEKLVPRLIEEFRTVKAAVEASNARPVQVKGQVANLQRSVESAWNRTAHAIVKNYERAWIDAFQADTQRVGEVVDSNTDAQDFIVNELTTREDLIKAVDQLLSETVTDRIRQQAFPEVEDLVGQALSKI